MTQVAQATDAVYEARRNIDPDELELLQRGTGRTSAMLLNAHRWLQTFMCERSGTLQPRYLLVVVAVNQASAQDLAQRFRFHFGPLFAERVSFVSLGDPRIEGNRFVLRGVPSGDQPIKVIYDHAAIYKIQQLARQEITSLQRRIEESAQWDK